MIGNFNASGYTKRPVPLNTFIFRIDTRKNTIEDKSIIIPFTAGTYNTLGKITIDWGDISSTIIEDGVINQTNCTHNYSIAGEYTVKIINDNYKMPKLSFGMTYNTINNNVYKLISIDSHLLTCINTDGTLLTTFQQMFFNCISLKYVNDNWNQQNKQVTNLTATFAYCTSLLRYPRLIGCTNLLTIYSIYQNANIPEPIPEDLFFDCRNVTSFRYCFGSLESSGVNTTIVSIPERLFKYNTKAENFRQAFLNCSELIEVPQNLFKYNTEATNFNAVFSRCGKLETLPDYLFRYNFKAVDFTYAVNLCFKLQLNKNLFCDEDTEKTTRFANVTPIFKEMVNRESFTGDAAGVAPKLWEYTYASAPTTTKAFYGNGNSIESLSNYNDIPANWK